MQKSIHKTLIYLFVVTLTMSCSKKEQNDHSNLEEVELQFQAMEENEFALDKINSTKAPQNQNNDSLGKHINTQKGNDFHVAMFVNEPPSSTKENNKLAITKPKDIKNKLLGLTNVSDKIKYRVYVYRPGNNTWQTAVFSSNDNSWATNHITIYKNIAYEWYAYSNNTTDEADVPDIRSGNDLIVNSQNKDLMWASGTIAASSISTNERLLIKFKHALARIELNFDYRGLFVNSFAGNNAFTFTPTFYDTPTTTTSLQKGNLNIKNGAMTGVSNYTPTNNPIFLESGFYDRQRYYYYTAADQSLSKVRVTYNNLNYTTYDGLNVVYNTASSKFIEIKKPSSNIPLQIGRNSQLNLLFIESPVSAGSLTTEWARANVYYAGNTARNPYRFRRQSSQGINGDNTPNDTYTTRKHNAKDQDLFMKQSYIPDSYMNRNSSGDAYGLGDPCALVLPAGAWKTASVQNYQNLIALNTPKTSTYYKTTNHVNLLFNTNNMGSPYDSRFLIFERNGLIDNANLNVSNTTTGYYWTDTPNGGIKSGVIFRVTGNNSDTWNMGMVDQVSQTCLSVRCVRTTLYQ